MSALIPLPEWHSYRLLVRHDIRAAKHLHEFARKWYEGSIVDIVRTRIEYSDIEEQEDPYNPLIY